jgi:hypothetical protein
MTDFEALLAALDDGDVSFIIVGGLAATIHGSSRLTQDVDIVYGRSDDNIERLVGALAPYDPYLRGVPPGLPFEWSAETIKRGLNFTLTTGVGDIDILGEIIGGGSYDDLLPHTVTVELFAHSHRCLDLPRLIHVKRAAGRPKDLEVIAELEALLEESV